MVKIDLSVKKEALSHNIKKAKENRILIPTIDQMMHPEHTPEKVKEGLKKTGLWEDRTVGCKPAQSVPYYLEK